MQSVDTQLTSARAHSPLFQLPVVRGGAEQALRVADPRGCVGRRRLYVRLQRSDSLQRLHQAQDVHGPSAESNR